MQSTAKEPINNYFLFSAAVACAAAALVHMGCIVFGGDWYRALGAGEEMARLAEAGSNHPTIVTTLISSILLLWSLYALSGARIIPKLPLVRMALCIITSIFLLRGLAFVAIMPLFPGNSWLFWIISSGICLAIGIVFLLGLKQAWHQL